MGIPGFNQWFRNQNKDCYVPLNQIQVDHLYVDLNSVLHSALRAGGTWEKFHKVLHQRLNDIVDKTNPRKTMMLAADGPAPLAKLLTQRERRKKVSYNKEAKNVISSTALTPGTRFMADVTLSLAFWVHTKLSQQRFSHLQFELSDATVQGEGEVKILGRLARHWYDHGANDTHVIVGDDADLVLMACVSCIENLYVVNSAMAGQQSGLKTDMPVFCTALLHKAWLSRLFHPSHSQLKMDDRTKLLGAKMDLMLLAVLASGNDYLPALREIALSTGASGGLWPYYRSMRSNSSQGAASSICHVDEVTGVPFIDLHQLASLLRACTSYHEKADCDHLDGIKATADASNYLRGCIWLLDMYINGTCPDYRYSYDGSAPSASRLIDACEEMAAEQGSPHLTHAYYGPFQPERLQPLLPFASAMALLPASGQALVPSAARHLMDTASPLLGDVFSDCSTCDEISKSLSDASAEVIKHKSHMESLRSRILAARNANDQSEADSLGSDLPGATERYKQAKSALHSVMESRLHHYRNSHPYEPFPIDRVAHAASSVDLAAFEESELPLASFSSPVVVARVQGSASNPPPNPFPQGSTRPIPKAVWRIQESAAASFNGTTPSTSAPATSAGASSTLAARTSLPGGGQQGLGLRKERAQLQPDALWLQGLLRRRYLAAPPSFTAKQARPQSSQKRRPALPLYQAQSRKMYAPATSAPQEATNAASGDAPSTLALRQHSDLDMIPTAPAERYREQGRGDGGRGGRSGGGFRRGRQGRGPSAGRGGRPGMGVRGGGRGGRSVGRANVPVLGCLPGSVPQAASGPPRGIHRGFIG